MTIRDPLDYTEAELRSLSDEDLEKLSYDAEQLEGSNNTEQMVLKVLMNGLYGALSNKWFPLFNEDIAAAITANGRFFIRKLAIYIEDELQRMIASDKPYIIYGDTDSVILHIEQFVELFLAKNPDSSIDETIDWMDSFENKAIQPIIQKCINDFATQLNALDKDVIGCEREILSDKSLFSAKKKYIMRVRDSEGTRYPEDEPYMKVVGMDLKKSGIAPWSKVKLTDALTPLFDNTELELRDWLQINKQEFIDQPINSISSVAGVNNIEYTWGQKGIPIGARSALAHNIYVVENGLENEYNLIQPGDKTKRIFLITPNKFNSNVIAYTNERFAQELDGLIDYDTTFEKNFLSQLKLMSDPMGYNIEKETEALDDW